MSCGGGGRLAERCRVGAEEKSRQVCVWIHEESMVCGWCGEMRMDADGVWWAVCVEVRRGGGGDREGCEWGMERRRGRERKTKHMKVEKKHTKWRKKWGKKGGETPTPTPPPPLTLHSHLPH
ncbi:MAG: hypothetical protein ACKERG_04460 [Candidatus Hodgkinia cicadicola]